MKLKFILLLLLAIPLFSFAQNDYATIYIYRPSNFVGSIVTDHIYFNNKKICEIQNGGYLKYKVFTENTIAISVYGTALGTESDKLTQLSINVTISLKDLDTLRAEFAWTGFEFEFNTLDEFTSYVWGESDSKSFDNNDSELVYEFINSFADRGYITQQYNS